MSGLLATSLSGLMAAQRSLETVQHNISNANTDGYSRQRVEQSTNPAFLSGDGFIGQGVNVTNVTRSYDQFINKQVSSSLSAFGDVDSFHQLAASVDNLTADPTTGMMPALNRFFSAVHEVANDPRSTPARQLLLSESNALAQNFNMLGGKFEDIRRQNNNDLGVKVNDINMLAKSIAELNVQIVAAKGIAQGLQPNDLLDKQDALLSKLSEIVNVSILPRSDGSTSVFIGNGQALVLNGGAAALTLVQSEFDPGRLEIGFKATNGITEISDQITGGSLGGALRFRDEVLDPVQQKLGQVAAGLAIEFNTLHKSGFDLNGAAGLAFFKFSGNDEVPVIENPLNTGNSVVTAQFQTGPSAAANLDYSDFKLDYNGATYTLTRVRDNQVTNLTATATATGYTLSPSLGQAALPGIEITIDLSGGKTRSAGDQFLIRPTYDAAQKIGLNINDPDKIAAATNIELDPVTRLPVSPVSIIKGPMPGDNSNALKLAALENKLTMTGGHATLKDTYGQIVSSVGTLTQAAEVGSSAQQTLLNQAKGARESLVGVNLDEEAANLIKFQQAYQASAQSISVARSLFDTLIGAVR